MGSTHAGHTPADKWPPMPRGGYQRAIPRDALTGEPIRPDTVHKRVKPDALSTRDNEPHTSRKRAHPARGGKSGGKRGPSVTPLPTLLLDDLATLEREAQVDAAWLDAFAALDGLERQASE